jgi:hypothetical protein
MFMSMKTFIAAGLLLALTISTAHAGLLWDCGDNISVMADESRVHISTNWSETPRKGRVNMQWDFRGSKPKVVRVNGKKCTWHDKPSPHHGQ